MTTFALRLTVVLTLGLAIGAFVSWSVWRILRGRRFTVRGLLIATGIVALLLAVFFGYRRAKMARLDWIPPTSTRAADLFPKSLVSKIDEGKFQFTYYARHCSIQKIVRDVEFRSYSVKNESMTVESPSESVANELLSKAQAADVLTPNTFVLRGIVIDRNGKPVPGATIDLLGQYVFINFFRSRDDGTFTLNFEGAPSGSGYYLRVRPPESSMENPIRWHTSYFSMAPDRREMVAVISVPR